MLFSLRYYTHFPGRPWLANTRMSPLRMLLEIRMMMETTGDNWNYKTYIQKFFTRQMPFLSPNQQCQSSEGKQLEMLL